jgi:hypothetical protein
MKILFRRFLPLQSSSHSIRVVRTTLLRDLATVQMATAPHAPTPLHAARRRASAVRRFPPGCGRQHSNAAPPPRRAVPAPYSANGDPPPKPSAKTSSTPAAARFPENEAHDRGGPHEPVTGTKDPADAEVVVRRLSAVRRYPPGCGRGLAVPKPEGSAVTSDGEAGGAMELLAAVCDVETKAADGDQELLPSASAVDNGDASSDGAGKSGGDGGGGALEGCGSPGPPTPPCTMAGITLAPLLPWAQHGQRSLQRRRTF